MVPWEGRKRLQKARCKFVLDEFHQHTTSRLPRYINTYMKLISQTTPACLLFCRRGDRSSSFVFYCFSFLACLCRLKLQVPRHYFHYFREFLFVNYFFVCCFVSIIFLDILCTIYRIFRCFFFFLDLSSSCVYLTMGMINSH